jgi:UV DNA damage endonuclease
MRFGLCCISLELKELGYSFQTMTYKRFSSLPRDEALEILGSRILNNMQVTHAHISYCAENDYTYRISSDLFPLITYLTADVIISDLPQYTDIMEEIESIKQTIQDTGVRVSVHPSEFNVLASTNQDAVDRTIRELNFYADFLDMIGCPQDYNCPMNMHINNRDGTNAEVTERFLYNFNMLQENVRNRLVIENDDKLNCWSVKQLIEDFYPKTNIPITFDYLHHACHPDGWTEEFAILACVNTWQGYRPLFHYSESAQGNNPRKHADYAEKDFYQYGDIDYDVDMELKQKDLAIAKFMEGVSV